MCCVTRDTLGLMGMRANAAGMGEWQCVRGALQCDVEADVRQEGPSPWEWTAGGPSYREH